MDWLTSGVLVTGTVIFLWVMTVWAIRLVHLHRVLAHAKLERRIAEREYELGMIPTTDYGREHYRPELYRSPLTPLREAQSRFERFARSLDDDSLSKEVARHSSDQNYNDAMVKEAKRRADEKAAEHVFDTHFVPPPSST